MARVILFDLDETLILEAASAEAAFLATCELARARYGIDPHALHRAVRHRARELWRAAPTIDYCLAMGIASWEALWSAFSGDDPHLAALREWMPAYRHESWTRALADCGVQDDGLADQLAGAFRHLERPARHVLFPDAEPALRTLHGTHRLAVVTNGPSDLQRAKLEGSGLARYFDAVSISTEVGSGKPDPRIFAHALAALGATPAEAVMVGDSLERDVAGARAAGIRSIWLNRRGDERPTDPTPDGEIATLSELAEALDHLPSVRLATEADAPAIATLHVRAWQWGFRGLLPDAYLDGLSEQVGQRESMWRRQLKQAPSERRIWVAERDGGLIGFCSTSAAPIEADGAAAAADAPTTDKPRTAELHTIYLDLSVVGTGVGAALMRHALADLRSRGVGNAILWVQDTNQRARRFYERGGWTSDGAEKTEDVWGMPVRQLRYRVSLSRYPASRD